MPVAPKIEAPRSFSPAPSALAVIKRILSIANIPLLISLGLLTAYGLLIVYSATRNSVDYSFNKQLFGVGLGVVLMIALWRFDYHRLAGWVIPLLVFSLILILMPLIPGLGHNVHGARSWIMIFNQQLQPSEPAKIVIIVLMAALVSRYQGKLNSGIEYLKCCAVLVVLFIAIMMQPDLGTGLVFFAIALTIFLTGGTHWKWLAITVLVLVTGVILIITLDPILDHAFGKDILIKDYQINRLLVFLNEDLDPTGSGYHLKQAKIAIGSGGMFGKGLYNATQSSLGFLPEAPTDFIFCVLAEELGFMGSVGLLLLFALLIATSFVVALRADCIFGTLIVMGCIGMWTFQILENIGMTCGLMPITGIPLPFVSYGSSFMVTNFMALGIILSVWAHRDTRKNRGI